MEILVYGVFLMEKEGGGLWYLI